MAYYETQTYRLWTYDVWHGPDGPTVNDRFEQCRIKIRVKATVYNADTPHELVVYDPTNRQLNRAIGARGLVWTGEASDTLYAETCRGVPVCELVRERATGEMVA